MPAQLIALSEGPDILLDKPILLLGRHPECDIQIDSRKISRRHCCIAQVDNYLIVRDLGSTNGIRINGVRVIEGRLGPSDELTIGNSRYQVRWETNARAANVPASARAPQPRPPQSPARPPTEEDVELEECDEPVPLKESPSADAAPRGAAPIAQPILPDDIGLAPLSDHSPPQSPAPVAEPAPSHH